MAVFLQNDVQITVNAVDLTDHVASVTWTESAAELETTAMGDSTVTMTPTDGAVAADNPKHSASALVTELPVIDGSVSDLATVSVTWPLSGAVTVSTAP
jgi:hypothetical protein